MHRKKLTATILDIAKNYSIVDYGAFGDNENDQCVSKYSSAIFNVAPAIWHIDTATITHCIHHIIKVDWKQVPKDDTL